MMLTAEQFLEQYLEPRTLPAFSGKVVESIFSTDARIQNGANMLLIWKVETATGPQDVMWGCGAIGSGWQSLDGGKTLSNRDGKKLNNNSRYFDGLLTRCAAWGLGQNIQERGGAFKAGVWVGTDWDFASEEKDFGGQIGKQAVRIVAAYNGGFGTAEPVDDLAKWQPVIDSLDEAERANLTAAAKDQAIMSLSDWAIANLPSHMSDPAFTAAIIDPKFRDALAGVF